MIKKTVFRLVTAATAGTMAIVGVAGSSSHHAKPDASWRICQPVRTCP